MWTIIKFDKKKIDFLKKDLNEKLGEDYKIYIPRMVIKKYKKNKIINKELNLLGDYLFCFHNEFKNQNKINQLKYVRGLKYFLNGYVGSQKDIQIFINKCKEYENSKGYIAQNIFKILENKKYKFLNGPFADEIFKVIAIQKNRINILIGNFKTRIKDKEFLFNPV